MKCELLGIGYGVVGFIGLGFVEESRERGIDGSHVATSTVVLCFYISHSLAFSPSGLYS